MLLIKKTVYSYTYQAEFIMHPAIIWFPKLPHVSDYKSINIVLAEQ